MGFNGSGTFLNDTAGMPVVTNTTISSTAFNALTADLATGLSTCITKDGQTTTTGIIPLGNIRVDAVTDSTGIAANKYTPTLTGITNVTGSTAYESTYIRVGNVVTVHFRVDVDPTAAAPTATELQITLPIASNIGATHDLHGCAVSDTSGQVGWISGNVANDKASLQFSATNVANAGWFGSFGYEVI